MSKENFPIVDAKTGKEYWISRSNAVVACIISEDKNGNFYGLCERRGPGCPDEIGKYAFPCGYLCWGETREEAVLREIREELGLDISGCEIIEWKTMDDPKQDKRENLSTRYIIPVEFESLQEVIDDIDFDSESRGGEKGEVDDVRIIPFSEVGKYQWAFNHDKMTAELIEEYDLAIKIWELKGRKNQL